MNGEGREGHGENDGDDATHARDTQDDSMFGADCLGQRIQAALYGAVGSLPRTLREQADHL